MQAYLAVLTEELRARRREVGVGLESKALVICDSATQHSASKFAKMREIWGLYRPRIVQCFLRISMLYVKRVYHIRILTLHTANNSLGSPSHQKTSGYEWGYTTIYIYV